ncbi:MAG: LpxL/LpxP family Kdo(2)-lipid IV(A) lauroyl/palmitoleoyl acyltransferase [Ketobacteraceae bacterium]|nr:LpxL/LpxP family Kdo(2)-lipid IV(A) lauroyl/palmitoleoyl acyltransferase [Ketobacteraceae bacterium]
MPQADYPHTAEPFPPPFSASLLHPRHWLTWLAMGIWYCIAQLPVTWQYALGRKLGHLLLKLGGTRVKVTSINIQRCLPELSQQEQQRLIRESFESAAIGLMEVGMGWWLPQWRFKKLCHYEGLEHIEHARQQNRGILLITGHFTPMEIAARMIGNRIPCRLLYRKNNNPVFEWVSSRRRAHHMTEMVPHKAIKHFLKCLEAGDTAIYLTDQSYGARHSTFAPFFGIETATIVKTAQYASATNAIVMPVQYGRRKNNSGYFLKFYPPLENFPSGNEKADAITTNEWVEKFARENPEQYFWQHRRFKHVPPDVEPFY